MFTLDRTIDATAEPVTVDEAKQHCRIEIDDDDGLVAAYITAARQYCEEVTGRAFVSQTWRLTRPAFPMSFWAGVAGWGYEARIQRPGAHLYTQPAILLPRPKLIGIVSVTYLDATATRQTLDPAQYSVDYDGEPASLSPAPGCAWPFALVRRGSVQVIFTAGYGSGPVPVSEPEQTPGSCPVPGPLKLAILMLVGHWYENREATVLPQSGVGVVSVPLGVAELLTAYSFDSFTLESD